MIKKLISRWVYLQKVSQWFLISSLKCSGPHHQLLPCDEGLLQKNYIVSALELAKSVETQTVESISCHTVTRTLHRNGKNGCCPCRYRSAKSYIGNDIFVNETSPQMKQERQPYMVIGELIILMIKSHGSAAPHKQVTLISLTFGHSEVPWC